MGYTEEQMIRQTPQVGVAPYRQIHAHSTGNSRSMASGEASYMQKKDLNSGFYTHVVGNGRVIQVAYVGQGAWDVGGGWNNETFAAVELIESHSTYEEFRKDYVNYINLLRDLADQGGIPKTLDDGNLAGIKTHYYCTYHQPNNFSDHVDPYLYLAKWGITKEQFKKDVENGIDDNDNATISQNYQDILDTNATLEKSDKGYYEASVKEDYYLESAPDVNSPDKELLKAGTRVRVYEKRNGWSRINYKDSDQWIEDDYLIDAEIL